MQLFREPTFEDELSLLGSTDGEGILRLAELAPGNYDLAARAPGFAAAIARNVAVGGDDPATRDEQEIELRLRPAGWRKAGSSTRPAKGSPAPSCTSARCPTTRARTG